jgi:hypothetical protein
MNNSEQQTDVRQQEAAVVETRKTEGAAGTKDQVLENTVKHLYSVESKVNGLDHYGTLYDNVHVSWNCVREYPIVPPEEGIKEYYEQGCFRLYARDRLNEYFSEEEAKALQDHLSRFKEITTTTVEKVDLPLRLDGRFIPQYLEECYNPRHYMWEPTGWDENVLPFTVWGNYYLDSAVERNPKPRVCPTCGKKIDAEAGVRNALDTDELTL